MPKYSTGDTPSQSSAETATACELCGQDASTLTDATIAGAQLSVCTDCNPHDDSTSSKQPTDDQDTSTTEHIEDNQDLTVSTTNPSSYLNQDTSHWEANGTNYDKDKLPYMTTNYGSKMKTARQEHGLTQEELAERIQVEPQDIELMESGQIRSTDIQGSHVAAIEEKLKIRLSDQQ